METVGSLHIGGDLVLGRHVIMEPDETKNYAHGFGYTLVIGKRHGLVQRDFDHLDKLALPRLTSTCTHAVVIRHLGVKHRLLGARYTDARPVGGGERKQLLRAGYHLNI